MPQQLKNSSASVVCTGSQSLADSCLTGILNQISCFRIYFAMKLAAEYTVADVWKTTVFAVIWLFFILVACLRLHGKDTPLEELRTAEQIRQLTQEQAAHQYPVRLQGVVTFFDQTNYFRFLQDDTAGIYFFLDNSTDNPPLAAGQLVEIEGRGSPGEYAPIVTPSRIQILGDGNIPRSQAGHF